MASRKKAGIDPETLEAEIGAKTDAIEARSQLRVHIDKLHPNPDQPRKTHDPKALEELKRSIKELGILQPLLVRPRDDNTYEIICGERRFRAAMELGLTDVPVSIRQVKDDLAALRMAYEENVQREDLPLLDEAMFLNGLIDKGHVKNQKELAESLGVSEGRVTQKLKVLKLPDPIRLAFSKHNFLGDRHAESLAKVENEKLQQRLFGTILERELSGRQARQIVEHALAALERAEKLPKRQRARTVTFKDAKLRRSGQNYILHVPVQSAAALADFFSALAKAIKDKELHLPRQADGSSSSS